MDNTMQPPYQQGYQQPYQQPQMPQQPYQQYGPVQEAPAMGFGEAISTCFKKYCDFSGRATRAEFWWFQLFTFLLSLIPIVNFIAWLALLLPSIAVNVRRMHDLGKGGGWIFIGLIPLVGFIWALVLWCTPSEPCDNRFGPYRG